MRNGVFSGYPGMPGGFLLDGTRPPVRPSLPVSDISPRLITAYQFSYALLPPRSRQTGKRPVIDYEMEYIFESSGSQYIDGVEYPVARGDLVFRRPGQTTHGIMPYSCFCMVFDLAGHHRPRPVHYMRDTAQHPERWQEQPWYQSDFMDVIPPVFHPSSGDMYQNLFETAVKHFITPGDGSELLQKAAILQILYQLHVEVCDPLSLGLATPQGVPDAETTARYQRIQAVLAYMRRNFRRKLPLQELAGVAGLSPTYLHRIFSETMNKSPLDYLNHLRMESARELLATSNLSAAAIAVECGFDNVPYFFTLFKRQCGETPASFRMKHRFLG